jgi:RNA polymerase sigma-70 factor (ECF subfamily)
VTAQWDGRTATEPQDADLPAADPPAADPPAAGPSDAELLRRHVAGDPDAFSELFRRHRDRLWAIAIRTLADACLDRLRRKAVRPASAGADEQTLDHLALGHAIADPSAASDTSLDVRDALRTLPPDQQAALVLVDMLGYPVADAAAVLGISQGTVKSRCARARARLLPRLEHLRRGSAASMAPEGNRSTAPNVSPAQGGGDSQP